ncbi:uncharacterized protein [Typha angustifolia]|uniref:uncharacterized protein n=1 Tax=Typha angustifolia TaxID=59011 RepID=UPI003C2E641B
MSDAKRKTDKVCDICGNIGFLEDIITCYRCKKASEHIYCTQNQSFVIPDVWHCGECLLNAPLYGGKIQHLSKKRMSRDDNTFNTEGTNKFSNVKHGRSPVLINGCEDQLIGTSNPLFSSSVNKEAKFPFAVSPDKHSMQLISRKTSKIVENAKVKFIPSEEVSFLTRGKSFCKRTKLGASWHQSDGTIARVPSCSQNTSAAMSTSPRSRSPLLTQPNMGSFYAKVLPSPRRIVSTEHISKNNEVKIQKNKSAGTIINSYVQSKGPVRQQMDLPATLIIYPSEKLSSSPAPEFCWKGTFEFVDVVNQIFDGIQAHFPRQVLPKVYEASKQLPQKLKLEIVPRHDSWPKIFKLDPPDYADIGIYFSCALARYKEKYIRFLERISSRDCAMQAYMSNIRLLIYSSNVLPADFQCIDGQIYLWGLFQRCKKKNQDKQEQSPSCKPSINMKINSCLQSSAFLQGMSEEVDMKIDVLGDREIQRVDKPIQRLDGPPGFAKDAPPGFSKPISSDVNHVKQSVDRFSLKKKLSKLIDTEVPPGFFKTPTMKQVSGSSVKFNSQHLFTLENNRLSVKGGGYFVGAAPKAREMQPKHPQAADHLNKPVKNFTGGLGPSVKKKRGITSDEQVLQDTNPPMISMKTPSISAKGNKCSSNNLFPEKHGYRELPKTETVVRCLCADATPKGGKMEVSRISDVGKPELSYETNWMENRTTGSINRLVDKVTKLEGHMINQGTMDEVQVSKIIVPDKANSKEDEGRYKAVHHSTPNLMDKQISLVSAHYDTPLPSPAQPSQSNKSTSQERTKTVTESQTMTSKESNVNEHEGICNMRRQSEQLSLVSCCYDSPFSNPDQALQSAGTVALPLFPEVAAKDHEIKISTERQDVCPELSLSRPQYVKNGSAWVSSISKDVLEQDGCGDDLYLKL